jgi:hypothetical protein
MENLKTPEISNDSPYGTYVPSEVLEPELQEAQNPATEDQVSQIISDSQSLVSEIPTTRHTEQDRFGQVDVDEATLDDVKVRHIHGQDGDVTVIEPSMDDKSARIVIDNNSGQVSIDGDLVDQSGADKVSAVISITRNMNSLSKPNENTATDADAQAEIDTSSQKQAEVTAEVTDEQPSIIDPEKAAKEKQFKQKILGQVNQLLKTTNGNNAFSQLAETLELSTNDLQEKMKKGDIKVSPDTLKALRELEENAAKPGSDIWRTDPRTPSLLGGAARESQQLLTDLLKNMF